MIQLHSTSGQLLNWLLNQRSEDGLFPKSKGWECEIQMQKFQGQLCYLFICQGEERKINFVIIEDKGFFPFQGKQKSSQGEQWVVFSSERLGQEVYVKAVRSQANLLVLSEGGVKFLHGEFSSKRIEHRRALFDPARVNTDKRQGTVAVVHYLERE